MGNLGSTDLKRLHREWRRRTEGNLALIMDGVQGPFNIGATIRTAAAERCEHMWFTNGATTPANNKVGKTALGTDRYITWSETPKADKAIAEAKAKGYQVVGIELAAGATAIHQAALEPNVCLVLGHEERGLSAAALEACDLLAFIPQMGKVGSLNVGTAASIAIYEVRRRAWTRTTD